MDAATQINSDEFDLLTQFSDMGIRVLVEGRKRRSKPKDDKLPLLTYKMMQDYAHSTMETKVEAMNCIEKYL